MSLNLLAILGGITGITGVAVAPITSVTSSSKALNLLQMKDSFEYRVKGLQETSKFSDEVSELSLSSEPLVLNTFPINYAENLTPGSITNIPLTAVWDQAKNLKKQAESEGWESWGYQAATFLAKGEGTNEIVRVEAQVFVPPVLLKAFIADLDAVAHGTPTIPSTAGFRTKVIILEENFLATQMYYVNLQGEETFIMESGAIQQAALGTILDFVGSVTTADFRFRN